jgi:DNA-binding NarL/FixJ family response regulator
MGINVLVADQQRTFADALAARLKAESDIEVVGAVQVRTSGPWLLAKIPADVLVLDGDLPGRATTRLCQELTGHQLTTRVIALSTSSEPDRIVQAIRAGATGWVRKDESLTHLLSVIRGVARGETWLPAAEAGNVVHLLLCERQRLSEGERLLAALTPREHAVLSCLAEAGHRGAVAEQMHLSVHTVRTHLQNLMAKLDVHSALEAVALIRDQTGWPPPDAD